MHSGKPTSNVAPQIRHRFEETRPTAERSKAANRAEIALLADMYGEKIVFAEKLHKASKSLPVPLYDASYGMGRHILSSALFAARKGCRATHVRVSLPTFRKATIEYEGPELRQDDATVLLSLIHRTRKGQVCDEISFNPTDFVKDVGWSKHSTRTASLRESIERMQSSLVRLSIDGCGLRTHLVESFVWESSDAMWHVRLDEKLIQLFEGGTTFIPRREHAELADGLQTWLACFLRAQSDEHRFDTRDLLKFSGSEATLSNFGGHLRETMPKLQKFGVVRSYRFGRASLTVER